jgi:hypothetical protein
MAKKFYSIGFEKIKTFVLKNKKQFRENLSSEALFHINAIFGKAYYDKAILDFFKSHAIFKDTKRTMDIYAHLHSSNFIKNTSSYCGFDSLLTTDEKSKYTNDEDLKNFFYGVVFIFFEKLYDDISLSLFERNFFHFVATLNQKSDIKLNYEAMTKAFLKPKIPKESFGEDDNGAFFKIIVDSQELISLSGASIKTMRKKGYKMLFKILIENKK